MRWHYERILSAAAQKIAFGEVSEWSKVLDSKSSVPQGTESSNLSLSANNYKASGIPVSLFYFSLFISGNKAGNKRAAALVLRECGSFLVPDKISDAVKVFSR